MEVTREPRPSLDETECWRGPGTSGTTFPGRARSDEPAHVGVHSHQEAGKEFWAADVVVQPQDGTPPFVGGVSPVV